MICIHYSRCKDTNEWVCEDCPALNVIEEIDYDKIQPYDEIKIRCW